jgi:hypothetical protein
MFLNHLKKADFEKTFRKKLELCKEHKPNGLILKFSYVGFLYFFIKCSDRGVVGTREKK